MNLSKRIRIELVPHAYIYYCDAHLYQDSALGLEILLTETPSVDNHLTFLKSNRSDRLQAAIEKWMKIV